MRDTASWPYPRLGEPGWLAGDPADDALAAVRRSLAEVLAARQVRPGSPAGTVAALAALTDLRERLDWALLALVGEGRAARLSWGELAEGLGVSRQAAQQRFGPYVQQAVEQARQQDADALDAVPDSSP